MFGDQFVAHRSKLHLQPVRHSHYDHPNMLQILVWNNPLILGIESLGIFDNNLIIRGQNDLASINIETGKEKWYTPLPGKQTGLHKDIQPDRVLGRAQRNGQSIYIANHDRITEIDIRDGKTLSTLKWSTGTARPLSFLVSSEWWRRW